VRGILLMLRRHAHILRRPKLANLIPRVQLTLRSVFKSEGRLLERRRLSRPYAQFPHYINDMGQLWKARLAFVQR
jgi:hypothetical protein